MTTLDAIPSENSHINAKNYSIKLQFTQTNINFDVSVQAKPNDRNYFGQINAQFIKMLLLRRNLPAVFAFRVAF